MLEFETLFRQARQSLKDKIVTPFPQDAALDDAVRILCEYFDKDTEHLVAGAKCKLQVQIEQLKKTITSERASAHACGKAAGESITALSSWIGRLEKLFRQTREESKKKYFCWHNWDQFDKETEQLLAAEARETKE